jgi:hypothetical protein
VEKPQPTIRIFKRRNDAGEIVGWGAEIKIPGINLWASVRDCNFPRDYYGSIYPTKGAAIEAAKREIIRRTPRDSRQAR